MWYAFWDADQDADAAFEHRLDSVVREIGDRGKLMLPEAVPPFHEPTPAPAPAPKRAPAAAAPAPAPAALVPAAAMPNRSFTPTVQTSPARTMQLQSAETLQMPLVERLLGQLVERDEAARQEAKAERAAMRAEMDELRLAAIKALEGRDETQRAEMEILREASTKADQMRDLLALQSRLENLHAAKLLADEELYAVEDIIAEEDDADGRVAALITLSGKMAGDGAFARQLRRKYA